MQDSFFLHIPPAPADMRILADEAHDHLMLSAPGSTVVCTVRTDDHVRYECRIDATEELVGFFDAQKTTEAGQLGVRVTTHLLSPIAAQYEPYQTIARTHSSSPIEDVYVDHVLLDTSFMHLDTLFSEMLHHPHNEGGFARTMRSPDCVVYTEPCGFGSFTLCKIGHYQTDLQIARHWPKDSALFEELRTALVANAYDYLKDSHTVETEEAQQELRDHVAKYHPLDCMLGIIWQQYHCEAARDFDAAPSISVPSVVSQDVVHTSCAVWDGALDYIDGLFDKVLCYERRQTHTHPPAFQDVLVMRADRSRGTVLYTSDAHFGEILLRSIDAQHTEVTITQRMPQDTRLFDAVRMHYCATEYQHMLALLSNTTCLTEGDRRSMLDSARNIHPLDTLVITVMGQMAKDYSTYPELCASDRQYTQIQQAHPDKAESPQSEQAKAVTLFEQTYSREKLAGEVANIDGWLRKHEIFVTARQFKTWRDRYGTASNI